MSIRFVEYGKRFIPYGTTDFVTLASSDNDIEKNVDYFRRSVLLFPSNTTFNDNIGNVSAALLGFTEGYLFVQIQSRREDECSGAESQMRRLFNQIRFSYLSRETLLDHFIRGDAVFTSLLYNDPAKNKASQPFRLPDYGWKSEDTLVWSESNETDFFWGKRHTVEKELEQYQFHLDVELLTNLLHYHLTVDHKRHREVFWKSDLDERVPKELELYYKLAVLQEAQALLFPYGFIITFTLDHVTEQSVFLRLYNPKASLSMDLEKSYQTPQENYYRTMKALETYIFEKNFSRYVKSIGLNMKDLILLYPLTKGQSTVKETEVTNLIRKHFHLLRESPRNIQGIPEDFSNALSTYSVDEVGAWAVGETNNDIRLALFQFLMASPRDFLSAYTHLEDEKVTDEIYILLKSTVYAAKKTDIENLDRNQIKRFWEAVLNVQRKIETNLKFSTGESILEGLLDETICPKEIAISVVEQELLIAGEAFINKLSEAIQELAAKDLNIIIKVLHILAGIEITRFPALLESLFIRLLKAFITLWENHRTQIKEMKEWSQFIQATVLKLGGNPLSLWTNTNELLVEEKNKFITICAEVAVEDISFSTWFYFRALRYASVSNNDAFKNIYKKIRESFQENTLNRLIVEDRQSHAPFCYLISVGAIPDNYSLIQALQGAYEKTFNTLPIFNLLIKIWIQEGWWTEEVRLGLEDVESVILGFEKSATLLDATQYNDILIKIAKFQQRQCQQVNPDIAKVWLTSTQKTWIDPKDGMKIQFYSFYSAVAYERKINFLWNILSNLERPDAEILWKISEMNEAIDHTFEICQSYIRQWQSKVEEVGIKEKKLLEYLHCASARFLTDLSDGHALNTLRKLVEVKYEGTRYSCESDREAMYLLIIIESVENSSIEGLAQQFLQDYLSKVEHVSVELMDRILSSDLEITSRLIKSYLNMLAAQRRLETQIGNMSAIPAQKIYHWAKENSARQVEAITERRLHQLGMKVESRPVE